MDLNAKSILIHITLRNMACGCLHLFVGVMEELQELSFSPKVIKHWIQALFMHVYMLLILLSKFQLNYNLLN